MVRTQVPVSSLSWQDWRTPQRLFDQIAVEVGGFGIDAFAHSENHLCEDYFSPSRSALANAWICNQFVFANPPYRRIAPIVKYAVDQVRKGHCPGVVLLLPANAGTSWMTSLLSEHEVQFFNGRVAFDMPSGSTEAPKQSPSFSNIVGIIRPEQGPGVTCIRDKESGQIVTRIGTSLETDLLRAAYGDACDAWDEVSGTTSKELLADRIRKAQR